MCFYPILTLKHTIRFQKINFIYISEFAKVESGKYIQYGLQAQKDESLTLKQVLKQKKTFA